MYRVIGISCTYLIGIGGVIFNLSLWMFSNTYKSTLLLTRSAYIFQYVALWFERQDFSYWHEMKIEVLYHVLGTFIACFFFIKDHVSWLKSLNEWVAPPVMCNKLRAKVFLLLCALLKKCLALPRRGFMADYNFSYLRVSAPIPFSL